MTLHRTPVHHNTLELVRQGQIVWREAGTSNTPGVPYPSEGFFYSGGQRVPPGDLLVALYELRYSKLLTVDGMVVLLTDAGRQRLSEWTAPQAVKQ